MSRELLKIDKTSQDQFYDALCRVGLFLVVVLFFLPSLPYDFLNWDDHQYIHRNPWLLAFHSQNIIGIFTHSYFLNYHPLTMLSYMVDFQLYGYEASRFRFGNIILHGLTVVVGFGILRFVGVSRLLAGLTMLYFAVHPLRIESVVWISERKDVLCGLFYLVAFRLYLGTKKTEGRRQFLYYVGCFCCFLLALFSKAMAITFPFVLICYDLVIERKVGKPQVFFYLIGIASSVSIAWLNLQSQSGAIGETVPLISRIRVVFCAPMHYTMETLFPIQLSPLYPHEFSPAFSVFRSIRGLIFSLTMGMMALVCFWRLRWFSFGLFSAVIVLAPVSGIVAFGSAWVADRYSYLPTFFLLMGLVVVLQSRWDEWQLGRKRIFVWLFIVYLLICSAFALQYMPHWKNSEALWSRVLDLYPDSKIGQLNVAHSRLKKDRKAVGAEAGAIADKVQSLEPARAIEAYTLLQEGEVDQALTAAKAITDQNISLKWQLRVLHEGGRGKEAVELADELSQSPEGIDPEILAYIALILAEAKVDGKAGDLLDQITQPTMKGTFARGILAESAMGRGDKDQAEEQALKGLLIFPAEFKSVQTLGQIYEENGNSSGALKVYKRSAFHPAVTPLTKTFSLVMMGKIYQQQGEMDQAQHCFDQAFGFSRLDEEGELSLEDYHYLGYLAEEAGNFEVAGSLYSDILKRAPGHLDALLGVAFVQMRQGNHAGAIETLEKAVEEHPESIEAKQNLELLRTKYQPK